MSDSRCSCQLLPRVSTFLQSMPCKGLQHVQSSRHCTGIASKLCSAEASSSLPDSCCSCQLPIHSCTRLRRTPCTCLRQARTSPRCRCSCSKLCSAQVSSSLLDSSCNHRVLLRSCTCLAHTICILTPSSRLCTCTSSVYPHKHSSLALHCKPTRPLHLSSSHCIHPHQQCCCRRIPRCQRPCRLRRLACIHCQRR